MIKKHIYDVTIDDLNSYPVWFFPMDESVDDETVIMPVENQNELNTDYQIIVKTKFTDKNKNDFIGYIYWGSPEDIKFLKPTLLGNDICITFWNGIREPDKKYLTIIKKKFGKNFFPIKFESFNVMGLKSIKGNLDGLYYINDLNNITIIKI